VERCRSDKLKELSHHRKHKKVKEKFVKKVSFYNIQRNYKGAYKNEHVSKGRFRGTDFWVEVKKQPAYPYAVLLQEISKNGVL
jgi:hypothetical protein